MLWPTAPELDHAISEHFADRHELDAICFPVLLFGDGIGPAHTATMLRLATAWSLEHDHFTGTQIWDSAGQEFVVLSAIPEIDLGPTGITRWAAVSLLLDGPRNISFEEIRHHIRNCEALEHRADILTAAPDFDALYRTVISLYPYGL